MTVESRRSEGRRPDGQTSVSKASSSGGTSAVVPVEVSRYLGLEPGDKLAWWNEVDPRTKEKITIVKRVRIRG